MPRCPHCPAPPGPACPGEASRHPCERADPGSPVHWPEFRAWLAGAGAFPPPRTAPPPGESVPPAPPPAPPPRGPCAHLGGPVTDADGRPLLRDCPACRGTVRLKVRACGHPGHAADPTTTERACLACPDHSP